MLEVFTSDENKNHMNSGFYIKIPLSYISSNKFKSSFDYSVKSIIRETGQFASPSSNLYKSLNSENNNQIMKKNISDLLR